MYRTGERVGSRELLAGMKNDENNEMDFQAYSLPIGKFIPSLEKSRR